MASTPHPLVPLILALRPTLPKNPDELRRRLQSIRVRSTQEAPKNQSWRNKQSSQPQTNKWRPHGADSPGSIKPLQRVPSFQASPTPNSPTPYSPGTPYTPGRYVTKFHNGAKKGDEQILNTIILNKLNVFSLQTYEDVKQFLLQILGSDQKEFVRDFTLLVFKKAAAEDKFCGLYAKLLAEIKEVYPVILEEMKRLHGTYLETWDAKHSDSLSDRLGYSQFLAELFALNVLDSDTLTHTIKLIKTSIANSMNSADSKELIHEYITCLRQLCSVKVLKHSRVLLKELLLADLNEWIAKSGKEAPGFSSKSKFTCMDLRDIL